MYGIASSKIRLQYRPNDGCLIHLIIEAIFDAAKHKDIAGHEFGQ